MEAAAKNALAIALFLEKHEGVTKVVYPGLESHPQHDIAKHQQHGFGAMITFYCVGGRDQSALVLQNMKVFALAEVRRHSEISFLWCLNHVLAFFVL